MKQYTSGKKVADPKPWVAVPPPGRVIKGPTRFAHKKDGYSNARMEFEPRVYEGYPEDHKVNRVLAEYREGHWDPYEFLQVLQSAWTMRFAVTEVDHAFEVIDRMLEVRHLSRVRQHGTE